jgi:hypothetical protein
LGDSSTPGSECAGTAKMIPIDTPMRAISDFIDPPSRVVLSTFAVLAPR